VTDPSLAIETRGLTRRFGERVALDRLDLSVKRGEVLALLGPNGAGKTTTVRLLNGVLTADEGHVSVLGIDPGLDGDAVRRRTGVLTENAGLDDRLTARENLEFAAQARGMSRNDARAKVTDYMDRFGMAAAAELRTVGFSTGQRKRLALARALLHNPELLFLDEPTSGLDPSATRDVTDLIGSLAREQGRTVVLATHFLGEAGRVADRMAVLDQGQLRAIGRADELAADLWDGVPVDLDLGRAASHTELEHMRGVSGVTRAEARADGATVGVTGRDVVPALLHSLHEANIDVYGANLRNASMEDVYFALEAQFATEGVTR